MFSVCDSEVKQMKTAEHIIETVDKLEEIEGLLLLPVQTEEHRDRSQCERYPGTYLSRT